MAPSSREAGTLIAERWLMSSLLDRFAYRKKENLSSREGSQNGQEYTPNKAHLPAVVRILETPESLLPSPTSGSDERLSKQRKRLHQRRRRQARIISSSEDETEHGPSAPLTPVKATTTLFLKLPYSKRRKCTAESEGVTVLQSSRTLTLDPCTNHPRKLFEKPALSKNLNGGHGLATWGQGPGNSSVPTVGKGSCCLQAIDIHV